MFTEKMESVWLILLCLLFPVLPAGAQVVPYPAPPGLLTSDEFELEVNGKPIWVEKLHIPERDLNDYYLPQDPNFHVNIANFAASGTIQVSLRILKGPVESVLIRPKSLGIQGRLEGNRLSFEVEAPQKLVIEVNNPGGFNNPTGFSLNFFANPLEEAPPKEGDPNVTYYGPGRYDAGRVTLQSGQTYYIAPGAVVYGSFRGTDVQDVKILGHGILDGVDGGGNCIRVTNCSHVLVDGLLTRNGRWFQHHINYSHHVTYNNVKVMDWTIYGDGIDPTGSSHVLINDCYIQPSDDCIAIKTNEGSNNPANVDSIAVTNCIMNVMKPYGVGDGITVGFECEADSMTNILVRNCDILHAQGGGGTGGHSAFSIPVWGPCLVKNVRFEDIRVEEQMEHKNFELFIAKGGMRGRAGTGRLQGVYLKNITWENPDKPFVLKGFDADHLVEDVTFDHCFVGGKLLTGMDDANFQVNEFVKDVKFVDNPEGTRTLNLRIDSPRLVS